MSDTQKELENDYWKSLREMVIASAHLAMVHANFHHTYTEDDFNAAKEAHRKAIERAVDLCDKVPNPTPGPNTAFPMNQRQANHFRETLGWWKEEMENPGDPSDFLKKIEGKKAEVIQDMIDFEQRAHNLRTAKAQGRSGEQ